MYEISSKTIDVLSLALQDLYRSGIQGPSALRELAALIRKHGHIETRAPEVNSDHECAHAADFKCSSETATTPSPAVCLDPTLEIVHVEQDESACNMVEEGDTHQIHDDSSVGSKQVDHDKFFVFVLGGPGSGKGTICDRLVNEHGFGHLSVGEVLRAEVASGSEIGLKVERLMKEGLLVPDDLAMEIIKGSLDGNPRMLLDGFPRTVDQAVAFESSICAASRILWLTCDESIMINRILARGQSSGRDDDNSETAAQRIRTFNESTSKIHDYYLSKPDHVFTMIDASKSVDEVYEEVKKALNI